MGLEPRARGRTRGRAALGVSVHTGWAALVAVLREGDVTSIVARERLEILSSDPERPRFVYHAAQKLPADAAAGFVRELTALARERAVAALRAALDRLAAAGIEPTRLGVPLGRPMPSVPLGALLASHALLHTAEGALFRGSLRDAGVALGLRVVEVAAPDLAPRAAEALAVSPAALPRRLTAVGRAAGRPWARDQRDAYLLAVISLDS